MAALTVPGVAVFNSAAPGRTGAAQGLSNGHSTHREKGALIFLFSVLLSSPNVAPVL